MYASVVVHFQEFLLQCKYDYKHWRYVLAFILHAYLYVLSHPGHDNTHGPECGIPVNEPEAAYFGPGRTARGPGGVLCASDLSTSASAMSTLAK